MIYIRCPLNVIEFRQIYNKNNIKINYLIKEKKHKMSFKGWQSKHTNDQIY